MLGTRGGPGAGWASASSKAETRTPHLELVLNLGVPSKIV